MAIQVQLRRGTTAQNNAFTGAVGEVTVDTDKDTAVVHDGATAGGFPLVGEKGAQTITGVKTFNNGLATDTISEKTSAAGVTIDGVLLKDSGVVTGAGTVSAPVYSTTGDTNTGVFFPAADTVAIAAGGVESARVVSGLLSIPANSTAASAVRLYEDTDNGTNYVDIIAPASLTADRTLTLPDAAGTLDRLNRAGNVLQVVEGSTDTQVVVSTVSYTDTGLTASITPSSASSKVLVIVSQQASLSRSSSNSEMNLDLQLLRGATVLEEYADYVLFANATGLINLGTQVCINYLDSPNTTSSTTYKLQGRPDSTANSLVATFQVGNRGRSSIILMEIAA
jgi:hypothetical protein